MNHEQLDTMKDLEEKQLVVKISGAVEQSNLAEFEKTALAVIGSINTNLQSDDDFAAAELNVKSCQLIEIRIHNARQSALNSTAEIAALISTTERLEAKFRETRLLLNSKVKTEKEARKNEIITGAKNAIAGMLIKSPVKHGFVVDTKAILDAAKGKRSLAKMREAVEEVVNDETLRLADLEETFLTNMEAIQKAELEYPGIFPDKQNVALSSVDVVSAQVESRIATFRYNLEMKAKREKEAAELKAMKEKEAAEKAQNTVIEKTLPDFAESFVQTDPPVSVSIPEPPSFPDPFSDDPPTLKSYVILVSSTDHEVTLRDIEAVVGVISVVEQVR